MCPMSPSSAVAGNMRVGHLFGLESRTGGDLANICRGPHDIVARRFEDICSLSCSLGTHVNIDACWRNEVREETDRSASNIFDILVSCPWWKVCFALHPDGLEIVTASRSLLLRHWEIATGVCKRAIKAHNHLVLCMDYDRLVFTSPAIT